MRVQADSSVKLQLVDEAKQDKAGYVEVARAAGIDIRVQMTPEDGLDLRKVMGLPQRAYARLHRWFLDHGIRILAPTNQVTKLAKSMLSPFEAGEAEISGVKRAFVRILSLEDHLFTHVSAIWKRGALLIRSNIRWDELQLSLLVDKGGSSTKLVGVLWNVTLPHSPVYASLLAEVEGDEDPEACTKIFGPICEQALRMQQGVNWTFSINDLALLTADCLFLICGDFLDQWDVRTMLCVSTYFAGLDQEIGRIKAQEGAFCVICCLVISGGERLVEL
jgi:hypothetical protein